METGVILIDKSSIPRFIEICDRNNISKFNFLFLHERDRLQPTFDTEQNITLLLSFGTSIIVPESFLILPSVKAINIHAASPDFPGRDPHHFAVYSGVTEYGATMHYMTKKVDDGPIIDTEMFEVSDSDTPRTLLEKANECGWILIERLLVWLNKQVDLPASSRVWGDVKRTRKDFQQFCKIDVSISETELEKRIKAFHIDPYENLYVELYGHKFYLRAKKTGE